MRSHLPILNLTRIQQPNQVRPRHVQQISSLLSGQLSVRWDHRHAVATRHVRQTRDSNSTATLAQQVDHRPHPREVKVETGDADRGDCLRPVSLATAPIRLNSTVKHLADLVPRFRTVDCTIADDAPRPPSLLIGMTSSASPSIARFALCVAMTTCRRSFACFRCLTTARETYDASRWSSGWSSTSGSLAWEHNKRLSNTERCCPIERWSRLLRVSVRCPSVVNTTSTSPRGGSWPGSAVGPAARRPTDCRVWTTTFRMPAWVR